MTQLNDELSIRLLGKITMELGLDMPTQLNLKRTIDEILYDYEITTKCTSLATSDLSEKAQLYIACKRLDGLSEQTLYNYMLFLNKLDIFFNKPVSTITTMDLRMFLATLGQGVSAATQGTYITKLKTFFTWLQNEEYIIKNPAIKLNPIKIPKIRKEPYTNEDMEKLRDSCKTVKEKAIFEVMASSACRVAEIAGLKIENINFQTREIKVFGKGSKERLSYISTRALIYVKKYLSEERKGDSPYLFVIGKKPYHEMSVRSYQVFTKKLQVRSGIEGKVHPHRFRRTQATNLLNSGMNIVGVQELLGHENITTTQLYSRLSEENLANEFKRLIK